MKKWLNKYNTPKAQNGIEGTMDGLTDEGFDYNGAWGGQFQMGGSLPGAVGFTYARTGGIPSNGPYAKKTKASAQNGEEMKYYQEGLDFNPKNISQDGTVIDPMGYWNPENVGNPVIIPSNIITMNGVNQPLIGISDTGDVQYMEPGEDYVFEGDYVKELPVAQSGYKAVPYTHYQKPQTQDNLQLSKQVKQSTDIRAIDEKNIVKNRPEIKSPRYKTEKEKASDLTTLKYRMGEEGYLTDKYGNVTGRKPVQNLYDRYGKNIEKFENALEVGATAASVIESPMQLHKLLKTPVKPTSTQSITRGFVDWGDAVNYKNNPHFIPRLYESSVKPTYVPPTTDPALMAKLRELEDGGQLEKLDQLTNFTNYNKPTKGGWLNKYK